MTTPPTAATPAQTAVLLVGLEAIGLAPRLEVSGYSTQQQEPGDALPAAVILSPGCEQRIPELRRRLGARPLLLGISSDSVESRSHCLEWGADDFWLPSLGTSDLLTRLRLHLALAQRQAPTPVSALLTLANLRIDPVARQGWRGQRQLSLTAREYQLLLLLLRHRGSVVSRERILEEIWADQGGGASNVIEVYVRYLRQKLEQEGESRLIHTVRGRGYCLSEGRPRGARAMSCSNLRRWALAGVVLLGGCGPGLTQVPPQFLPITAQWCLEGPPPARCIQLEVPRGERQQAMGLQLRPPLPHLRGMWFPYAPPRWPGSGCTEPRNPSTCCSSRAVALFSSRVPCRPA